MGELARGTVADRPWGRTLGALGMRGLTGQLTLVADGRRYCTAFVRGAVVGATSPLPTDAAVRVALTGHLISSTQVADIARRQAAAPARDEVDVVAELARLSPEQTIRLRRRVVAQRAARTFSIDRGDFLVEDEIALPVVPGSELDIRAVIYLGARQNLSEQRLASELGQIGTWFLLKADVIDDLPQYGFGEGERPVLELLREGGDLVELEKAAPGIEQRMVRSVVYSLASCNAFEPDGSPRAASMRTATVSRTRTPSDRPGPEPARFRPGSNQPPQQRTADTRPKPGAGPVLEARTFTATGPLPGRARTTSIELPRTPTPNEGRARTTSIPAESRTRTPVESRTRTPTPPPSEGRARTTSIPAESRTRTPISQLRRSSVPPPMEPDEDSGIRFKASKTNPPGDSGPVRARTSTDRTSPPSSRTTTPPARARTATQPSGNRPSRKTDPALQSLGSDRFETGSNRYRTTIPPVRATTPPPFDPERTRSREPTPIRVSQTRRRSDSSAIQVEQLIEERIQLVDMNVDHFQLLGVAATASMDQVRDAYYGLARQLHPDRLASMGITDPLRQAHRLFAQVNTAFAILSDQKRRRDYSQHIQRGGDAAVRQEEKKVDELAMRLLGAEEAYKRGEMALRRDALPQAIEEFKKAVELNKEEVEYQAMLTWAMFCAAPDKMAIASETRKSLERSIGKSSPLSVTARFYLGRVERMLGRDREALNHFHEVLSIVPNHGEATGEIRVIESRIASSTDDKSKSGIFGRHKR